MFKIFRSLLSLFQIYGVINEILFWPKLLFLKCPNQSYMWSSSKYNSGGKKQFIYIKWQSLLPVSKINCGDALLYLFFVGSQFVYLSSLAPTWCIELRVYSFSTYAKFSEELTFLNSWDSREMGVFLENYAYVLNEWSLSVKQKRM